MTELGILGTLLSTCNLFPKRASFLQISFCRLSLGLVCLPGLREVSTLFSFVFFLTSPICRPPCFVVLSLRAQSSALEATPLELRGDLALQVNEKKGARVGSACFESPLFRKVRMTYFDAGAGVQVFNSLWYPRFERDAPPTFSLNN